MLEVNITELRHNISEYMEAVAKEDILVLRSGKPIARITLPDSKKERIEMAESLFGIVPESEVKEDLEIVRMEHLEEKHGVKI